MHIKDGFYYYHIHSSVINGMAAAMMTARPFWCCYVQKARWHVHILLNDLYLHKRMPLNGNPRLRQSDDKSYYKKRISYCVMIK